MCHATDCTALRAAPLDVCPVYFGLRDALFPDGADVDGQCALALFWLAHHVGELPLAERRALLPDLVALFTFALRIARDPIGPTVGGVT